MRNLPALGIVVTWLQEADFRKSPLCQRRSHAGFQYAIRDCDSGHGNYSIGGIGDRAIHASRGLSGRTGRPGSGGSDSKGPHHDTSFQIGRFGWHRRVAGGSGKAGSPAPASGITGINAGDD